MATVSDPPMAPKPSTFDELETLLADPDVPDTAIRPYLTGAPQVSLPFAPVVVPDATRVAMRPLDETRVRGPGFLDWANRWSRWRRQKRFERRLAAGDPAPVLVSEGDSWFQFPFLLDDVVDQLEPRYLIRSLDAAGDTLAAMTGPGREYVAPLVDPELGPRVRGFLFSAGGNDIIGEERGPDGRLRPVLETLLHERRPGLPAAAHIDEAALEERLARIEAGYRQVLETVAKLRPGVFVVGHAYARAIPAHPADPRDPAWTRHGGWLRDPLRRRGFEAPEEQRAIVAALIDRLHARLERLMGGNCRGGAYPHGWLVDCRNLLDRTEEWADEIHPSDAPGHGFARVAQRFDAVIRAAMAAAPAG